MMRRYDKVHKKHSDLKVGDVVVELQDRDGVSYKRTISNVEKVRNDFGLEQGSGTCGCSGCCDEGGESDVEEDRARADVQEHDGGKEGEHVVDKHGDVSDEERAVVEQQPLAEVVEERLEGGVGLGDAIYYPLWKCGCIFHEGMMLGL